MLTIVPWLSDAPAPEVTPQSKERFIAWPAMGQEIDAAYCPEQWIPLSPTDMYCTERFGLLVDQVLCRMALITYAQPLQKSRKKCWNRQSRLRGFRLIQSKMN